MTADRVLIVDDNPDIRAILSHRLLSDGFDVETCDDPLVAFQSVVDGKFDLVLLDIMMPKLDGYGVLAQLRKKYPADVLPVIMLTSSNASADVVRALSLGANDFAVKGEQWDILLRRMRTHLSLKKNRSQRLGPYELQKKLGSGSMGVVFQALDTNTQETVALKVLPRAASVDEMYVKRFMQEAKLASRISHPNIVRVLGAGRDEDTYYLAMELLVGQNLEQRFGGRALEPKEALAIVRDVALGLSAMHDVGVAHRDIKPQNIFITTDNRVVITDFGIAFDAHANTRLTAVGIGVGSPSYSAPEQLEGRADERADIYSLGATLYVLLTGVTPYRGADPQAIYNEKISKPADPSRHRNDLPKSVTKLVSRMMSVKPSGRFANTRAVVAAIDEAIASVR